MRYLFLFCLVAVLQSCSRDDQSSSFSEEDELSLSLCQLVSDDSNGESWKVVKNAAVRHNETISNILKMMEPGYEADPIGVPMTPYLDLIICRDIDGNPLFAIAQKINAECVRISSFEVRDKVIFIGGEKLFDSIVYSDRVELAENLRDLFPNN
jgi:hypothetical protein